MIRVIKEIQPEIEEITGKNLIALQTTYKIRFFRYAGDFEGSEKLFTIHENSDINRVFAIDKDGHSHDICYAYEPSTGLITIPSQCIGIDVNCNLPFKDELVINNTLASNITNDLEPKLFFSSTLRKKIVFEVGFRVADVASEIITNIKKVGGNMYVVPIGSEFVNVRKMVFVGLNSNNRIEHLFVVFTDNDITSPTIVWSKEEKIGGLDSIEWFGSYKSNLNYRVYDYTNHSPSLEFLSSDTKLITTTIVRKGYVSFERTSSRLGQGALLTQNKIYLHVLIPKYDLEDFEESKALILGSENNLENFQLYNYNIREYSDIGNYFEDHTKLNDIKIKRTVMYFDLSKKVKLQNHTIENNTTKFEIIPEYVTEYRNPSGFTFLFEIGDYHTHLVSQNNLLFYNLKGRVYVDYWTSSKEPDIDNKKSVLVSSELPSQYNISDLINNFITNTNFEQPILLCTRNLKRDILEQKALDNYTYLFISDEFDYDLYSQIIDLRENSSMYIKVFATNRNVKYPLEPLDDGWVDTQSDIITHSPPDTLVKVLGKDLFVNPAINYYEIINGTYLFVLLNYDLDIKEYDYIILYRNYKYYVFKIVEMTKTQFNKRTIVGIFEKTIKYRLDIDPNEAIYLSKLTTKKVADLDITNDLYAIRINTGDENVFINSIVIGIDPFVSYYEPKTIVGNNMVSSLQFILKKAEVIEKYFNNTSLQFPIIPQPHNFKSYYVENYVVDANRINQLKRRGLNIINPNYEGYAVTSYAVQDYNSLMADQQVILQVVYVCQTELRFLSKVTRGIWNKRILEKTLERIKNMLRRKKINVDFSYVFDLEKEKLFLTARVKVSRGVAHIEIDIVI
jgi:hypothetical protein